MWQHLTRLFEIGKDTSSIDTKGQDEDEARLDLRIAKRGDAVYGYMAIIALENLLTTLRTSLLEWNR